MLSDFERYSRSPQASLISGHAADGPRQPPDGFEVMGDDFGPGFRDFVQSGMITPEVGDENFHGQPRVQHSDRPDGFRPMRRTLVGEVVAGHRGDHGVLQVKRPDGPGQALRFIPVGRIGNLRVDLAEPAVPGAFVTQDHECCCAAVPAFSLVGAVGADAYRMEPELAKAIF